MSKISKSDLEVKVLQKMEALGVDLSDESDAIELVQDGIQAFASTVLDSLAQGRDVQFNQFGGFKLSRRERTNINPATGERIGVTLENFVVFTPSKEQVIIHES